MTEVTLELLQRDSVQQGDCWVWQGVKSHNGYGRKNVRKDGKWLMQYVHRLAYVLTYGSIPKDMVIDHLCKNRACFNPSHLEVVTTRENLLRSNNFIADNIKKTHCPQGHEYSEENIYVAPKRPTTRGCRKCRYQATIKYQKKEVCLV